MTQPYISIRHLSKSYGTHPVLKDISFEVSKGEIFALLGENGAGKTTTVKILSTVLKADGGHADIGGYNLAKEETEIRRIINVTGQYATIDEQLNAEENLMMMGRLQRLTKAEARLRAAELLEQFDLTDAKGRLVKTYSGGMKRRLDIAISLIVKPQILFLDEPTTGLDPRSRSSMWKLIRELASNGMTVFLTTQYLEEADFLADKIVVLNEGMVVANGTPSQLKALIANDRIDLIFASAREAESAEALLRDESVQSSELTISVPLDDAATDMRRLLNKLHEHGCMPAEVHLRKPTLDDVFMQLTAKGEVAV